MFLQRQSILNGLWTCTCSKHVLHPKKASGQESRYKFDIMQIVISAMLIALIFAQLTTPPLLRLHICSLVFNGQSPPRGTLRPNWNALSALQLELGVIASSSQLQKKCMSCSLEQSVKQEIEKSARHSSASHLSSWATHFSRLLSCQHPGWTPQWPSSTFALEQMQLAEESEQV